jgi:hypothetical protein
MLRVSSAREEGSLVVFIRGCRLGFRRGGGGCGGVGIGLGLASGLGGIWRSKARRARLDHPCPVLGGIQCVWLRFAA